MALVLYGTLGCHLCDVAEAMLLRVLTVSPVDVYLQDIADDPVLVEQYGVRIPVIYNEDNGQQLDWPFDEIQLQRWLQEQLLPSLSNQE
ncbi:MAG: glutaredoxin family protein [Bacterioplanes sp.]|nr:glutaredoxin family protein [Bacterioplanes sp.]